jgi:ribonuclease T2
VPLDPPVTRLLGLFISLALLSTALCAQERNRPGDFDFYVLSLSWSPTYCATDENPDRRQCDGSNKGFVVHGLWPQFERGYPRDCRSERLPQRIPESIAAGMSDLMPSKGLVFHEWRAHGICSGLYPADYFALVRQAAGRIKIPGELARPAADRRLSPDRIEAAFATANPGLDRFSMAVACEDGAFSEIRICLDKALGFRRCPEVDRDACRAPQPLVPAAR